ncbi:hypothetical protein [Actinoplanes sp. NPDC026670]|uniref:hypothetical protein n=1 Tax=Actinoplanes sp. NPDC026670 TaxID=3154700 RepID=UPI003410FE7A
MTGNPTAAGPAAGQPPPSNTHWLSAATRHMCAGAYLDENFARTSVEEVYQQPQRAVAPSFGFDLGPVLMHCRRAYRIALIRDGVIAGALLLLACTSGIGLILGLALLAGWHTVVAFYRMITDTLRRIMAGERIAFGALVRQLLTSAVGLFVLFIGLGVAIPALGLMSASAAFGSSASVDASLSALLGSALLTMIVVFVTPAATSLTQWSHAVRHSPGRQPEPLAPDHRIEEIQNQQRGNTSVYSGYSPFIGSGTPIGVEGFALRMIRSQNGLADQSDEGAREFQELPFSNGELVAYVGSGLAELATAHDPARRIPGLTVADRLFVAGNEALWSEVWSDAATISQVLVNPTDSCRHYLECQVTSWNGELITSVYVHFLLAGRTLYLEIATNALTPCQDLYRTVDDLRSQGAWPYLRAAWWGLASAASTVASAPINLVRAALVAMTRQGSRAASARLPRGFDYGAQTSVRELASPGLLRNDFQTQDVVKFKNILTRRVVASTLDFLVAKGVDVTEFRQRANVLINEGVIVGGNVGKNAFKDSQINSKKQD